MLFLIKKTQETRCCSQYGIHPIVSTQLPWCQRNRHVIQLSSPLVSFVFFLPCLFMFFSPMMNDSLWNPINNKKKNICGKNLDDSNVSARHDPLAFDGVVFGWKVAKCGLLTNLFLLSREPRHEAFCPVQTVTPREESATATTKNKNIEEDKVCLKV